MESENQQLSTAITHSHHHIADGFVRQVQEMFAAGGLQIKSYAIDTDLWGDIAEVVKFKADDRTTLEVTVRRKK